MAKDDPYHDIKVYHYGLFSNDGRVSAMCYRPLRQINLNVATWTTTQTAVTCKKCLALIDAGKIPTLGPVAEIEPLQAV